jgi:5-enolpyruvylshikimate-3-phosphate synthase
MKLYELVSDFHNFMEAVDNDEIPEEAIADTLESIELAIEDKADNIACLLKNLDAEIAAFKAEETRLAERRKAKEKTCDRIKDYLADNLQRVGIDKMETIRNKITFRKSESVEVDEAAFIKWAETHRDDLLTYSKPTVNKTAVKKALKDGAEVVGASIVTRQNIQIK